MDRDDTEDMDTIYELDSGLTGGHENRSLDRKATRKRRSVKKLYMYGVLSLGLLCMLQATLNICLRLYQESPCKVRRDHLMVTLGELAQRGWLYFNHSLYFVSTTKKNWTASRDDCLKRNAHLVVINSIGEQEFVSRLNTPHWIGLSDRDTEGTWKWVDGTNMTSSFWGPGEPGNKDGEEDCVVEGGDWSDAWCDRQNYWICEKAIVLDLLEAELNKEEMYKAEEKAIIALHPSTKMLYVGDTARFSCRASGTPEPTIEWLYDGRPPKKDRTDNQSEPAVWVDGRDLIVRGVRSGVHTVCCRANNSAGTANRTAKLNVYDACELTLDPNTTHRHLSLSEDKKTVVYGVKQSYPNHPDRFDFYAQVLCRENLTDHCYWEVEWKGRVEIGVTYRGITRRGEGYDSRLGSNNKSWHLYCYDDHYAAWYNGSYTDIRLRPSDSNRVGVYVDRPAGTLSFYRVSPDVGGSSDTLTHIHTFHTTFTQEDLLPAFGVHGPDSSMSLSQSPARV